MTKKTIYRNPVENSPVGETQSAAAYYSDLTDFYLAYGGEDGWHYGIWEEDVKTHSESLVRSNEILVKVLKLTPDSIILDVGCGTGSFAVWCAKRYGCRVIGITICPDHPNHAKRLAEKYGVKDLCRFMVMDMDSLTLKNLRFDCIINQESICYAADRKDYLERVFQLLKPGGFWSAITFSLRNEHFTAEERELYTRVKKGFFIPKLVAPPVIDGLLKDIGYTDVTGKDLTELVQNTARTIVRNCRSPLLIFKLHIDWLFYRVRASRRKNFHAHFSAGDAYSRGLINGCFRHYYHQGRKPL